MNPPCIWAMLFRRACGIKIAHLLQYISITWVNVWWKYKMFWNQFLPLSHHITRYVYGTRRRRHFQGHFHEWELLNFNHNLTEICSLGSNSKYGSIGPDNGLAPNRRQAIIWTNDDLGYWRIYASLGLNELKIIILTHLIGWSSLLLLLW